MPTDIAVSVVSSTAISVSWTAGYDGEVQQSFHIQYKATDAQDWTTKQVADHKSDDRQSIDLEGLKPATDYMLRIFAANAEGNSSLSETLTFRMKMKGTCILSLYVEFFKKEWRKSDVNPGKSRNHIKR